MQRCFDLARLGAGNVSPNPMVGAVLVHEGRIIGEGWHQQYGQAHAEVNAVNSVRAEERKFIPDSTLYVSLEPCNVFGKTPPCTSLILKEKIKKVVISCIDHTPGVKGGGVAILENAGVEVVHGVLEKKGQAISAFRNTFTAKKRPFIQLKFAKSKNGYMGQSGQQVWISNLFSKRLAHKCRAEYDAILIGTTTALTDSPQLTNRLWYGKSPLRIVLDRHLKIPFNNQVFSKDSSTWVVTEKEVPFHSMDHVQYHRFPFDENLIERILALLFEKKKTSLIVEGGAYTLNQFIKKGFWDEAWVFTGKKVIEDGIVAPLVFGEVLGEWPIGDDLLTIFSNPSP
ncbi:MAG: bifunctional diaminohydroxyphosphoribosylaminopyrimidine deaminase/5-amino-6-(5-phosphoribosylamino)uracil reductase RibD [Saprospiraceae bacterium]